MSTQYSVLGTRYSVLTSLFSSPLCVLRGENPRQYILVAIDSADDYAVDVVRTVESAAMNLREADLRHRTRRQFFRDCNVGLGTVALASLLNPDLFAGPQDDPLAPKKPHFSAKAKNVIFLHMAGAPSTLDLFDYKPKLIELNGKPCPDSYMRGQQFAFIANKQPKLLGTPHKFSRKGQSGQWMSSILPHLATVADELTVIRSMHTDQFNHAPAQLFVHTGSPRLGRPGMGCWASYGLGSENRNLPSFVVLVSGTAAPDGGASLWGSGFLPTIHQGVQLRSQGDPVLFLSNPDGMDPAQRRRSLDALKELNQLRLEAVGDPEIATRMAQYEMAYRMQTSVPEIMDISRETKKTHATLWHETGAEIVRQQLPAGSAARGERRPVRATVSLGLGQPR